MDSYTLHDLNEYLKRVIALNFPEPLWISAEIAQCKMHRGQAYLELVQQDDETGEIIARSSAAIWYKSYLFLKNKLKELLPAILSEGTQVLLKVRIDFNEKYGMKLIVEDIDPAYTIGQMEMERKKIIERLKADGFYDSNKHVAVADVFQSIAIISSAQAAGYQDFIKQLESNSYGYAYKTTLFQAAMQGQNVESEVTAALREIRASDEYDTVVIIRGGGSKLDLSYFDNYNIAAHIAKLPIPCLIGIGHEIDESVADLVSYRSLKTPTAAADYLIERTLHFESDLLSIGQDITSIGKQVLEIENIKLESLTQKILFYPVQRLEREFNYLDNIASSLFSASMQGLNKEIQSLSHMETIIQLSDPQLILKKGYSIIKNEDGILMDGKHLSKGDNVIITFRDTTKKATIDE